MSNFKNIVKEGWHPKARDGGKESWRSDFKGINQVAGWMGKGKDPNDDRSEHASQPLSSLKDPASFGPPPKHVKYHGAAALPNETTPDRSGLGAPLPQEQISHQNAREQQQQEEWEAQQAEEEAEVQRSTPAGPYRVNTTGLRTDHLPPPPKRVDSPASSGSSNSKPKPSLPPRLPPRNSTPVSQEPPPPPAYSPGPSAEEGYVNQGATSRLANAGVSVPALGIGEHGNGSRNSPRDTTTSSPAGQAPVNELQSRFAQMRTPSNVRPAPPPPSQSSPSTQYDRNAPPPASGGIKSSVNNFREQHADKIDAGKQKMSGLTQRFNNPSQSSPSAQNDHNDQPQSSGGIKSSVNNFRDQHADKIDAGKQKMSGLSTRFNNYVDGQKSLPSRERAPPPLAPLSRAQPSPSSPSTSSNVDTGVSRKKPPPPPPKRADMRADMRASNSSSGPPPLPLNTKPR